jgi:hypothetical protein
MLLNFIWSSYNYLFSIWIVKLMKKLLKVEWEMLTGLIAAVTALVMHFLGIGSAELLLVMAVVLMALLFLRNIRQEQRIETILEANARTENAILEVEQRLKPPEMILIGPHHLRAESERFCKHAQGEFLLFHVCLLMFRSQALFDLMLRPAIENPLVTSIRFILNIKQRELWDTEILPKLEHCQGKEKILPPQWAHIEETISFMMADAGKGGNSECLVSFWGEPFMAYTLEQGIPRYIIHVRSHSELVPRLVELERKYRLSA